MAGISVKDRMSPHTRGRPLRYPGMFHSAPKSLRAGLKAALAPGVSQWRKVAKTSIANAGWTEECNGLATDGKHWYVASNKEGCQGIYKLSFEGAVVGSVRYSDKHLSALAFHKGKLYVPLMNRSIAVFDTALKYHGKFVLGPGGVGDGSIPWCAINPWNGYLYTSTFNEVTRLHAYDPEDGFRYVGDLGLSGAGYGGVQAATFSTNGHVYVVSDKFEYAHPSGANGLLNVHSAMSGINMEGLVLPNDYKLPDCEEVEGVVELRCRLHGVDTHFHILVLDNDKTNDDDVIIWHYQASAPELI